MDSQSSRIYFDAPKTAGVTVSARKGEAAKQYLDKVARLVPIEIIGGYKAATLLVAGVQPATLHLYFYWGLFLLGLVGTLWYMGWQFASGIAKQKHLMVYAAAFVVWAYATTGDKLLSPPYYQDAVAGILLIVASLFFGKIDLPKRIVQS
jgi:hypothetical protein